MPLITPLTAAGELDEAALDKLIDSMRAGGVEGVFVLGTTGEGVSVPRTWRLKLVQRAVERVQGKCLVYAGIGDTCLADAIAAGNQYLETGAAAVVAQPPVYFPLQPPDLKGWFPPLLDAMNGPVIIYNIPSTTRVSIPLELVASLVGHPRLVGIKDSENDPKRQENLLRQFGGQKDFAIFVGVGALMFSGLKLGANGIVPSVGNLIPNVCHRLCETARHGDWAAAESHAGRMSAVAAIYQKGRTLGPSLAALKAALHHRGLCGPHMLPPLEALAPAEMETVRGEMKKLHLLD